MDEDEEEDDGNDMGHNIDDSEQDDLDPDGENDD